MLFVLVGVAVGMLLMLLVGLVLKPDDGQQSPRGGPATQLMDGAKRLDITAGGDGPAAVRAAGDEERIQRESSRRRVVQAPPPPPLVIRVC